MRASGRAFAFTSYVTAPPFKARIHAGLIAYGYPCPVSDLFGARGRVLLGSFALPEAWRTSTTASLRLIEHLDSEIDACAAELRRLGAAHPYVPLLMTAPGIASRAGLHHRLGDR
jgi:transposase